MIKNILISACGGGGTDALLETAVIIKNSEYVFKGITDNVYGQFKSILGKDQTFLICRAENELEYIQQLNQIIIQQKIDFFIPNSDIEAYVVSKYNQLIQCETISASFGEMQISQCKEKTHQFCLENNLWTPKTKSYKFFIEAINCEYLDSNYPKWCRTKTGAGSKNSFMAQNKNEVVNFINSAVRDKKFKWDDFIVSDFLPGEDCLITSIWVRGKLKYIGMANRVSYIGAPGQSPPNVIITIYRKELEDLLRKCVSRINPSAHGLYNIDIKYDNLGKPNITEFNLGRFYYNMPIFNSGTISMFDCYLDHFVRKKDHPLIRKEEGWHFLREQDKCPTVIYLK